MPAGPSSATCGASTMPPRRSAIRNRPITSGCRSRDGCGRKAAFTTSRSRSRPRTTSTSGWRSPLRSSSRSARPSSSCCRSFYNRRTDRRAGWRSRATPPAPMPSKVVSRTCGRRNGSCRAAIAKLKEGLGSDEQALPADVARTLDLNLQILDQAIADSSDGRCRRNRRTSRRATASLKRCNARSRCCRTRSR